VVQEIENKSRKHTCGDARKGKWIRSMFQVQGKHNPAAQIKVLEQQVLLLTRKPI
jgi:hypothetical protein